jgi:hypothetical protein
VRLRSGINQSHIPEFHFVDCDYFLKIDGNFFTAKFAELLFVSIRMIPDALTIENPIDLESLYALS